MWTQELRRQHRHIITHWKGPQACSLAPEAQAQTYAEWRVHQGLVTAPVAVFSAGKLPIHAATRVRKVLTERLPSAPQVEVDPAEYGRA